MPSCTIGQLLAGRYRLEREIGRGGMATVFEATDLQHQRRVAVKTLDPELAVAVGQERFLREIRIVASLAHPHILPLHDSGAHAGTVFYVMPFVEGESLRARLHRQGALPVQEALRLGVEIADALAYAHARGVIHRDVKPENILLHGSLVRGESSGDDHALVADFGIARGTVDTGDRTLTATGVSVGTPAYMSPEQAVGDPIDARSDLFSLGSVLYEMLTGRSAFGGESAQQTIARVLTAPLGPVSSLRVEVPAVVDRLLERMLAKNPAERSPDAASVARAMREALERRPTMPVPSFRRVLRRKGVPPVTTAAVGAIIAIAAIVGWALANGRSGDRVVDSRPDAIAVLPFELVGTEQDDRYRAEAIAEELVAALGQIPGLRVVAHTSSFAAARATDDVREIGQRLGVAQVVTGTLRRTAESLRLRVTLVNTRNGQVVWSDSIQRRTAEVLTLQDDLTRSVLAQLSPRLTRSRVPDAIPDPEAHDLLLQARYLSRTGRAGLLEARTLAERAIRRDASYAAAWAGLSRIHQLLALFDDSTSASLTAARQAAEHAVALDTLSAEANAALGTSRFRYDWRWDEAERYLQRAIALNPSLASAHQEYGRFLRSMGRFDEARRSLERAAVLDPLGGAAQPINSGRLAFFARDYDRAIRETRTNPDTSGALWLEWLAMAHVARGDLAIAESLLTRPAAALAPGSAFDLAIVYARTGREARARALLDSLRARSPVWASQSAWVWAALGEADSALKYLERAVATHDGLVVDLKVHPMLDPIRHHPRFRRLLEGLRFPQ